MADFVFSDPGGRAYLRIAAAHPDASRRYSVQTHHHFQTSAAGVRELARDMLTWIDAEDPQLDLPLDPPLSPARRRQPKGEADAS